MKTMATTSQYVLGIQLFIVCPSGGKPLIGLTLTAQLSAATQQQQFAWPELDSAASSSRDWKLVPRIAEPWFSYQALYSSLSNTKGELLQCPALLPISFPREYATTNAADAKDQATNEECDDNDDDGSFLQFVDKAHQDLGDSFCEIVKKANEGVLAGCGPELCEQGEGGTYFLCDADGNRIAVFKPADEDPQAENNPKHRRASDAGLVAEGDGPRVSRKTIPKGEAAIREVAAYELDRGFAGVPTTRMVKAKASFFDSIEGSATNQQDFKMGSLQAYVESEGESWDLAPYKFSTKDVHKIGIFDIRALNTDRHGGNILAVSRDSPKDGGSELDLVPIDHGFCFPTALSEANWEWLYWPQAKKPFDAETLRFIDAINVDEDSAILRRAGLSEEAVRVNGITTMLLKRGAAAGLNLFEIAKLCLRKRFRDQEETSPLEKVVEAAEMSAAVPCDDPSATFWRCFDEGLSVLVQKRA